MSAEVMSNSQLELVICRGLPGSGKSTWAAQQHGYIVVNKDDIRAELAKEGWVWSPKAEADVLQIRDGNIRSALYNGKSVISSDTNLADKHINRLTDIARKYKAVVTVKDFTGVPPEVCIQRDAGRDNPVGERVITEMYYQYLFPLHCKTYTRSGNLPNAFICDLDGTVALHNGRSPYDYNKCDTDLLNEPVAIIVKALWRNELQPVYVSGREDYCREKTLKWLKDNGLPDGPLFMRATGDSRKDTVVKYEIFNGSIRDMYDVWLALDDRDQVVKLWRGMGITCLQVEYGNF
jgi:predicted kinase